MRLGKDQNPNGPKPAIFGLKERDSRSFICLVHQLPPSLDTQPMGTGLRMEKPVGRSETLRTRYSNVACTASKFRNGSGPAADQGDAATGR